MENMIVNLSILILSFTIFLILLNELAVNIYLLKVIKKSTRTKHEIYPNLISLTSSWCFCCLLWTYSKPYSSFSIVFFKHVIAGWADGCQNALFASFKDIKDVIRTQSNIEDGAFCKNSECQKAVNCFLKRPHLGCLPVLWIYIWICSKNVRKN